MEMTSLLASKGLDLSVVFVWLGMSIIYILMFWELIEGRKKE